MHGVIIIIIIVVKIGREHIQRMDDNRLPKKKLNYKPEGRRIIGKPQTK
jgi:hypothetical protein